MAGIFNGPVRGGTRGGRDQFSWDNVKSDKEREYYLGHSVKALTGRWQKGKDVYWYTRDVERNEEEAKTELAMVKQREQDLMMEALGIKPKAPKQLHQPQLDKADMQKLLQGSDEGTGGGADAAAEGDRVKGLGFNASMVAGTIQGGETHETLAGVGAAPGAAAHQQAVTATAAGQQQQQQAPGGAGSTALTAEQIAQVKRLRKKQEKKAAKKEKKEAKKGKKRAKKEKHDRKQKRSKSSSGNSSGSESEGEDARARGRQPAAEPAHGSGEAAPAHGLSPRRGLGMQPRQERSRSRSPQRRDQGRQRSRSPLRPRHNSRSPPRRQQQQQEQPNPRRSRSPRRQHDTASPPRRRHDSRSPTRRRHDSRSPPRRRPEERRRHDSRSPPRRR